MKIGNFIGQVEKTLTKKESDSFLKLIKKEFKNSSFSDKILNITSNYLEERHDFICNEKSYKRFCVKVTLKDIYKVNNSGNTAYFNEIWFMISNQYGYNSYEKSVKETYLKFSERNFDTTEFSMNIYTNGRKHLYRKHHKYDHRYEGKGHYIYGSEIEDFKEDLKIYLKNISLGL